MDDRELGQKAAEAAMGNDPGQGLDGAEELFVGWCDASLDAGHWFKLAGVAPLEAAMLLCNLNPQEETQDTAELASSDCTSGVDFKRLVSLFEDANRVDPSPRPLGDWLDIANVKGAKHHPWVGRYLSITRPAKVAASTVEALKADLATRPKLPTPSNASVSPAPASRSDSQRSSSGRRTEREQALRRRDLLAPVIERAQSACTDPMDSAEVFAELRRLAGLRPPTVPLVGFDEQGIHWIDAQDETQILNRKALGDRLKRQR